MSAALQRIEREALALPAEERAELVDKLWDSLADTTYPPLSDAWRVEIERRRQQLATGQAASVSGEEVSRRAWQIANTGEA